MCVLSFNYMMYFHGFKTPTLLTVPFKKVVLFDCFVFSFSFLFCTHRQQSCGEPIDCTLDMWCKYNILSPFLCFMILTLPKARIISCLNYFYSLQWLDCVVFVLLLPISIFKNTFCEYYLQMNKNEWNFFPVSQENFWFERNTRIQVIG